MNNHGFSESQWTREQLEEFLRTQGILEDFSGQDYEDLFGFVSSIRSTMPEPIPVTAEIAITDSDVIIEEDTIISAQPYNPEETEGIVDIENTVIGSTAPSPTPPAPTMDADITEEEKLSLTLQLCEAAGISFEEAQKILNEMNWNLTSAIMTHYENSDIDQARAQRQREFASRRASQAPSDDGTVHIMRRMNIPNWSLMREIHSIGGNDDDSEYNDMGSNPGHSDDSPRKSDEYDEEGIRKPDPVRHQRLVSTRPSHLRSIDNPLARADDPSVEWMHPPAGHLSFPGSFQDAKSISKDEKRWLIVNIQSHHSFASHTLNRDVWPNETIESIIRSSFYFWQRGHTSEDGKNFMRIYQLTESDLPCISIIDCRTGLRLLTIKGLIAAEDLLVLLVEFMEANSFDSTDAPNVRFIDTTTWDKERASVNNSPTEAFDSPLAPAVDATEITGNDQPKEVNRDSPPVACQDEVPLNQAMEIPLSIVSYGTCPSEPDASSDSIKISVKLVTGGKPIVRRFLKTSTVRELFAFVLSILSENESGLSPRSFDLLTSYPPTSLSQRLDSTLEAASVAGSQVIMRWI